MLLAFASASTAAAGQGAPWVAFTEAELRAVLSAPPTAGSPAAETELDAVRALQAFRTPALVDEANADAPRGPVEWARHVLGADFDPARQSRAVALLERVHQDVRVVNRAANAAWPERPRPARVDARIVPSLPNAIEGPSYPSARTAGTRVWAEVLAELYPHQRQALLDAAERSAWLRLLGGAHTPSDLVGGRRIADAFLHKLRAQPQYRAALAAARAEAAQGTSYLVPAAADAATSPKVVVYQATAVGRQLKYAVLLPRDYATSTRRYPVLYLLHGHTGHYRSWIEYAGLPLDTADHLEAIVVLADGGNAFYANWHGADGTHPQRWEEAIVRDLVGDVDGRWRTRVTRDARAIGGLSMGGYGAIAIALRHPDVFGFAFSSAGALRFAAHARDELASGSEDWNRPELWSKESRPPVDTPGFATQRERTPRGRVFATAAQANAADPFVLAGGLEPARAPFLHLDAGLQDELLPETLAFAERLRARGLPHALVLLPGGHEVPYWRTAFERTALSLRAFFAPPSLPAARP